MGTDGDWSWGGHQNEWWSWVEGESAKGWERRLEFADICYENEVQWKLSGIYKVDPNEDS